MYNSTDWKDHITEHPHRRKITENGDGTSEVVKDQGEVLQQGTPQSATNFNNMESRTHTWRPPSCCSATFTSSAGTTPTRPWWTVRSWAKPRPLP